jgi:ankyrin repeat protein
MAAVNPFGSKDKAKEILTSHLFRPGEQSVLPPFSGELRVDEGLKLSNENFKQTISDFFKEKDMSHLSQLTATPAFPTPHVLAQFASKSYRDYKKRETDAQYETRLDLPDGWKLLTTASNSRSKNGYFGAAYFHADHQHVVIAHRGTKLTNLGALWADIRGVLRNQYVRQMESASTFAHKVVELLRNVNQEKGTNFQVFFTGHSLGGWLAQITTFTTKYIKIEQNTFLKSDNEAQSFHPHTVVFDSPGCKDMLSQMTDKFDVRLDGRSIDIEHLDITSYLSAPNLINTCNLHVGTVYRIFPDLSDKGGWKKHIGLYTIQAHRMANIVQVFDSATGQVSKDEKGNLKIKVVVDWPSGAGFHGKEYRSFFKWANQFNSYHPDITNETFQVKGYHPMRYQTRTYDEKVSRLSVFCQQERQFLESYRWLRQFSEFFNPKELFSTMGNNQAQEEAEKILQSFEIENDTIRCADGTEIQALIAYVKGYLRLFPQVKDNVKTALSSHEIVNWFYRDETRRYEEQINQSPLHFKADTLNLRQFVDSDEQKVLQLRMCGGDSWTGLIKVCQVLGNTPSMTDRLSEGHYTILTLQHLLLVERKFSLNTLLQSTTAPHLLLLSGGTNQLLNEETKQILSSLFNTVALKKSVKIILTTHSEDDAVTFLQDIAKDTLSDGFVARDEQLTWSDLTTSSQDKLLHKPTKFQGARISLNELMSAESPAANFLPLGALLEENELTIADPVFVANAYKEIYYIGRTLRNRKGIIKDIFVDKSGNDFHDLIACSEQEFKTFCQQYPKSNVHWLEKDKSGKIFWQKSQGNLEKLRRYIDTESSNIFTPNDLGNLLEQAQHQGVVLISDTAGMGKSTLLTYLSEQIKQNFPAKWVARIGLNDHTDALSTLQGEQLNKEKAIDFVSEKLLKLKPGLEVELFKECCEQGQKVGVVIMLDGFDEICPFYKETVIDLLQTLRQTAVEQLWVTTRPHQREELEDNLQQLSYTLEPFSEENQVEFLSSVWCLKEWFTEAVNETEEDLKTKLEIWAKELIKKLFQSISDKDKQFTGIPLQCRMLADAFEKNVEEFFQSAESMPDLAFELDLLGLYSRFIEMKYEIYVKEKGRISMTNMTTIEAGKHLVKNIIQDHQILALKILFGEELLALLQIDSQCTSSDEDLTRTGIVQMSNEGKLQFIHRTFAEFYVADFFVNYLTKESKFSKQIQDFILQKILRDTEYRLIRVFIDGLLSRCEPTRAVLKQYGNRIHDLREDGELTLYISAHEGNSKITGFLLDSLEETGHADTLVKLLLPYDEDRQTVRPISVMGGHKDLLENLWKCAKKKWTKEKLNKMLLLAFDSHGQTAWHVAARLGNAEVLEELWEWTKEAKNTERLNKNMLLAKDDEGNTVLHHASHSGDEQILDRIRKWAKDQLKPGKLNKLLLAQDKHRKTAWHVAARWGKVEALDKLWEWAKEVLNTDELNNKLLLAKDDEGHTVLHNASLSGDVHIFLRIRKWAKEQLKPEELNKLLLAQDNHMKTAWHVAAERDNVEILDKLCEWAKEVKNSEEVNIYLLLAKDDKGNTVLHNASFSGNLQVFLRIRKWAKEQLKPEELNTFLLVQDNLRETAWHVAAQRGNVEILDKLCEWAKEVINTDRLNNNPLLAKDYERNTVLHNASLSGNVQIFLIIRKWAKEQLKPEELNNLLLAQDNHRNTAWHVAVRWGNIEVLGKLWEWAKEVLNTDELNNKLLLANDDEGNTVLHHASFICNVQTLERIRKWAKDQLKPEELNKLLLAQDNHRKTAWHVAVNWGNTEVLGKLWEWAKDELNTDELNNKLLLAKYDQGNTVLHHSSFIGNVQIFLRIRKWAKDQLKPEELNKLLLAQDNHRKTAWHVAAHRGNVELLDKLWEWAKEVLNTDELNNKLLFAKDDEGNTVMQHALFSGNLQTFLRIKKWAKEQVKSGEIN